METKKDPIFPNGIIFKRPKEGAPEWIKGSLSIKVDEAIEFLKAHANNGWVNLDLKKSKEKGTLYLQLNDWKPEPKESYTASANNEIPDSEIPF